MTYIVWLIIVFGSLLAALFLIDKSILFEHKKILLKTPIGSIIFAYLWDVISIKHAVVWYFPKPLLGIEIALLPLEEFLFIIGATIIITYLTLILCKKYAN